MLRKPTQEQLNQMDENLRKQWAMQRPLSYAIYKGVNGKFGCFQFKLSTAYDNPNRPERMEGGVFIEAAPAIGPNKYDWKKKVIFALSVTDIGKVLSEGFRRDGKLSLYHDPGAKSNRANVTKKSLRIEAGQRSGFFMHLREETAGNEKTITIPVSPDEATIIVELLKAAIPKILGW